MRPNHQTNIPTADASADQAGAAIDTSQVFQMSAQAVVTGTSTGTLKLQFSNDGPTVTNWSDIAGATVAIAGAGTYAIPKADICYGWTRCFFAHTNAAAGTITVNTKSNGA